MSISHRLGRGIRSRVLLTAVIGVFSVSSLITGIASAGSQSLTGNEGADKPTVVLVHGAWADASGWTSVVKDLHRKGYPVIAPANPLRGLSSDSAYLASVLADVSGPIILVGHSYGGAVMTNAAVDNPNVKALVYIAGFAPAAGDTVFGLIGMFPGSEVADALHVVPYPLPDGEPGLEAYIQQDKFPEIFAGTLTPQTAAAMAATQRPAAVVTGEEPSAGAAWETIPSWYMVAKQDKVIPPDAQRFMAERAGSYVVEVKGPHAIMVAKPQKVTELIERAASSVN